MACQNPKAKGNAFERKVAKELSNWMFENDSDVLKRESTSGGVKTIWCGDIVPMKQMPDSWNKQFPFLIECKSGYEEHSPTFWSYAKIESWYKKAYKESLKYNQNNILLICQFKNKSALLFTNNLIPVNLILFNVAFPIIIDNNIHYVYCYKYTDVLQLEFKNIYGDTRC